MAEQALNARVKTYHTRQDPWRKLNCVVVDQGWRRRRTGVVDVAIRSIATSGKKELEKIKKFQDVEGTTHTRLLKPKR